MATPYSKRAFRQDDPNIRKEFERRGKSGETIIQAAPAKPEDKSKPIDITSIDKSIDIVKSQNRFDLSVYRNVTGYEGYYEYGSALEDLPDANALKLPINRPIATPGSYEGGWIPFVCDTCVLPDEENILKHTGVRIYEEAPYGNEASPLASDCIYFQPKRNGIYQIETKLFLTLAPLLAADASFCMPENYYIAPHNNRIALDSVVLGLFLFEPDIFLADGYITRLGMMNHLIDRKVYYREHIDTEHSYHDAARYTELGGVKQVYMESGQVLVPFYKIMGKNWSWDGDLYNILPFPNSWCSLCQRFEWFYVSWRDNGGIETDPIGNDIIENIVINIDK